MNSKQDCEKCIILENMLHISKQLNDRVTRENRKLRKELEEKKMIELNDPQFSKWIQTSDFERAFREWKQDEDLKKAVGHGFCGRDWDAHVESCRRSGRDPYD